MVNSISSSGQVPASTDFVEDKDSKKSSGTSWKVVSALAIAGIFGGGAAALYFDFNPLRQEPEVSVPPTLSERLYSNIAYIVPSSYEDVVRAATYIAPPLSLIIGGRLGFKMGYKTGYVQGARNCELALNMVLKGMGVEFHKTPNRWAPCGIETGTPYLLLKRYNYAWLNDKTHFPIRI